MPKSVRPSAHDQRRFWKLGAILLGLPLVAVLWLISNRSGPTSATHEPKPEVSAHTNHTELRAAEAPPPQPNEAQAAEPERPDPHDHGHDVTLASAESEFKPGDPSHPMSEERRRAYRQTGFIGQIDGAILVRDAAGIRRLNAAYRAEYPDDDEPTRQAYDMIADCIENKTPELVARARKFWETKRSSRARRDLRKICLQ